MLEIDHYFCFLFEDKVCRRKIRGCNNINMAVNKVTEDSFYKKELETAVCIYEAYFTAECDFITALRYDFSNNNLRITAEKEMWSEMNVKNDWLTK